MPDIKTVEFNICLLDPDTGHSRLHMVCGEIVKIAGMPDDSCAAHANHCSSGPAWVISHVASGMLVGSGRSLDEAIHEASIATARRTEAQRDYLIAQALWQRNLIERITRIESQVLH